MFRIVWFLFFVTTVTVNSFFIDYFLDEKPVPLLKILGGEYVNIKSVPYLAQILFYDSQICGGIIISKSWILTAAHCLEDVDDEDDITVITGSSTQEEGKEYDVAKIISHEKYCRSSDCSGEDIDIVGSDIALIKLEKPIRFNERQKPIAITSTLPKPGEIMQISGFGQEGEYEYSSEYLKTGFVTVTDQNQCKNAYRRKYKITDNMFCAGADHVDSCTGDSGGPGVINDTLVGITSFGEDCGSKKYPGVYTQVYNFREWISKNTGLKL